VEAPYSRIPALPAALGLAAGIVLTHAGAAAWTAAAMAVLSLGLWLWRSARFFAALPAAAVIGMALALAEQDSAAGESCEPPKARGAIARTVLASELGGPAAAFVTTTLVADSRYLQQSLREDFRGAGLAHVLALSGFHVGVVAMLALWLTRPMLAAGRAAGSMRGIIVLAAVWAFACLGGLSASLLRAAIMCSLLVGSRLAGRYPSPLNSLAVAAIVILSWRPWSLYDVGFQLSFAAVAGILAFAGPLNPFSRYAHPRLYVLASGVAVPLGATMATAPVVAATFGSVPLLFLPANMLLSVVFAPFYALALILVALTACGMPAGAVAAAVDCVYSFMASAADVLDVPVAVEMTAADVVAAYVAVGALCLYLRRKRRNEAA